MTPEGREPEDEKRGAFRGREPAGVGRTAGVRIEVELTRCPLYSVT